MELCWDPKKQEYSEECHGEIFFAVIYLGNLRRENIQIWVFPERKQEWFSLVKQIKTRTRTIQVSVRRQAPRMRGQWGLLKSVILLY